MTALGDLEELVNTCVSLVCVQFISITKKNMSTRNPKLKVYIQMTMGIFHIEIKASKGRDLRRACSHLHWREEPCWPKWDLMDDCTSREARGDHQMTLTCLQSGKVQGSKNVNSADRLSSHCRSLSLSKKWKCLSTLAGISKEKGGGKLPFFAVIFLQNCLETGWNPASSHTEVTQAFFLHWLVLQRVRGNIPIG